MDDKKYLAIHDSYIVKSNDLIQKSRFKLSLQQQKVVLYLCSQIQQTDEDFRLYTIPIREFCQMCGIDGVGGRQYAAIQNTLEQLKQKSYIINLTEHRTTSVSWVDKWYLDTSEGVKSVQIRLDPDMKPYLLRLKSNYTKYEYAYTLRMTHKATPRLYELLKSYHYDKTKPYDKSFSVDELRQLLDADDKASYQQFRYFRSFVLEPAVEEITEQTDIIVTMQAVKQGRTVVEVVFHIQPKDPAGVLEAAGDTYQAYGYNYVGSSRKDEPEYKRTKAKKGKKQPVKASTQPAEKPLESSDSKPRKDAIKPLQEPVQEPKTAPAEQQPEQEQELSRIQVRIYVGKKRIKSPSKAPDQREQLDAIVKKFLLDNNLEPLEPFEHSEGASFRLNCRRKES